MHGRLRLLAAAGLIFSVMLFAEAGADATSVPRLDVVATQRAVEGGAVVIDVRRPDEWRSTGIVPGSVLITAYDQKGQLEPGFLDRVRGSAAPDQPVVLICRSGNRSEKAAQLLMTQAGYRNVSNADGGIVAWAEAGRPVAPCPNC